VQYPIFGGCSEIYLGRERGLRRVGEGIASLFTIIIKILIQVLILIFL
jgi:hypothetical protein